MCAFTQNFLHLSLFFLIHLPLQKFAVIARLTNFLDSPHFVFMPSFLPAFVINPAYISISSRYLCEYHHVPALITPQINFITSCPQTDLDLLPHKEITTSMDPSVRVTVIQPLPRKPWERMSRDGRRVTYKGGAEVKTFSIYVPWLYVGDNGGTGGSGGTCRSMDEGVACG